MMIRMTFLVAALVSGLTSPAFSTATVVSTATGVSLAGHADRGTIRLYVNEEVLATTEFDWEPQGRYQGNCKLSMAGQTIETSLRIEVDDSGHWTRMEMETPRGPATVERRDTLAVTLHDGETSTTGLRPGTILFENFSPALISLATSAYDETRGGKQSIPVFIVPSVVMEASIERLDTVERAIEGRDVVLTRYRYGLPNVDVYPLVDSAGRVVFADVPAQHAAYVREGWESLRQPAEEDSLLSQPIHDIVIDRDVRIPMRDDVELATDIYRPDATGRFPVVLVRTPYKKDMNELQARFFSRRGYVYAVQDCRGRFASEGDWEPFFNEPADGYDTIEWLAEQPWSNGRVGMIGPSYLGWVQWWAAREHPPHLATIIPNVAPPDPYLNIPYEYGCFFLLGAIWWADILETEATADLSGKLLAEISKKKYAKLLRELPVIDLDEKVLGRRNSYWREWIAHPDNDEYWARASFLDRLQGLDIPVFHQSGWFDGDGIGSKLNYLRMVKGGARHQKLVLGPWGHTDSATRRIGDRDFSETAILDLQRDYLRWLDRWLKDVPNGIDEEPLVSIFVMGTNEWLQGDRYPLPETKTTPLYLTSGGHANSSAGDGGLVWDVPGEGTPPDHYVYDPGDPTPSPGYYVDEDEVDEDEVEEDEVEEEEVAEDEVDEPAGTGRGKDAVSIEMERERRRAYHAQIDRERSDILVYDTEPLSAPLTIAGPISATLYAATSARDTDWFVRLSEVDAGGEVFGLVEGKLRARYRESLAEPILLEPGEVYRYDLDLWQTGITIPQGRSLRVEVCSASFPSFSRNLNTGGHNEMETRHAVAEQTIYHDAAHPSLIVLPVIEGR